jgi:hypothetical protein
VWVANISGKLALNFRVEIEQKQGKIADSKKIGEKRRKWFDSFLLKNWFFITINLKQNWVKHAKKTKQHNKIIMNEFLNFFLSINEILKFFLQRKIVIVFKDFSVFLKFERVFVDL